MKFKAIGRKIYHESRVIRGKVTRDMTYESCHTYPDVSAAKQVFGDSVVKLLHVKGWSRLSVISADLLKNTVETRDGLPRSFVK